jgi:hypothetical protein
MSSTYNTTSTSVDAQSSREYDDLGLNNNHLPTTPFGNDLLSPYNHSQTLSNSASPSYNISSTPGESLSEYSNYQPSELSEIDDPFFGVNFDAGVQRIDSLPSALPGHEEYHSLDLNRPLPGLPPHHDEKPQSATFSASSYPLSPVHSSIPNTPSPKRLANDLKGRAVVSQHELTSDLHHLRFQTLNSLAPTNPSTLQLTPDHSGSSHTSAEGLEPSDMAHPEPMVSQYGNARPLHHLSDLPGAQGGNTFGGQLPNQVTGTDPHAHILRTEDGMWQPSVTTGQAGLDPERRREISDIQVPTLKEQEAQRRLEHKNIEVEEWRSQAGGSSDEDEVPTQPSFPPNNQDWYQQPDSAYRLAAGEVNNGIPPLDDDVISSENKLVEGQTYFNPKSGIPNDADIQLMQLSRHWHDAPAVPYIMTSTFQPPTSIDAMKQWNTNADTWSIASRAATWGTRRRSEPSLADFEAVADGNFLKKLSISKPKDENRPRQNSLFDQGLDRLANIVRKRSDSKLKRARSAQNIPEENQERPHSRHNSQGNLVIPRRSSSFNRRQTPSINTAFAAMAGPLAAVGTTHTREGSVSGPAQSPKSPTKHLGFRSVMKRARSKSDFSTKDKVVQPGLTDLWRGHGGPPIANLAKGTSEVEVKKPVPPKPAAPQPEIQDDDDDDEEDELGDENDVKLEEQQEPIIPNYDGFKAHVRRLNPEMDPRFNWLVSRIAHQQEIRYKNLLELRVKHSQAIIAGNCSTGADCLGGDASLIHAKGNRRDSERTQAGLQLVTDFSDDDSNPGEGALTDETFPQGVPMPPTRNLPAEFECQLCFKAKKFTKPSDWTKHVHEDVQPFTCTYDKCKEPKSFKRKADWVRHENERHRHLEWWICQVDDCRHPCYRKDNFLQHLVREHKLPEPKQKTKAAIKKARLTEPAWIMLEQCHHETLNRPQDEPCKFCGKSFPTWKKLTVHLAKHMEHISLPILRLVEARSVDATTIISPVEQILTPVTPVGRAKLESTSPFNMDSISPHVPMIQNFATTSFDRPTFFQGAGPPVQYNMHQVPIPQEVHYNQSNMYQNGYGVMEQQPRAFGSMGSDSMGHMIQNQSFGTMDPGFQPKVEPRGYGSIDSNFSQTMPNPNYNLHQTQHTPGYSMAQNFSAPPAVSGYQTNMLGITDGGYYDPATASGAQTFQQQVPMSRAQGSASSYGHSPQSGGPYYNNQ